MQTQCLEAGIRNCSVSPQARRTTCDQTRLDTATGGIEFLAGLRGEPGVTVLPCANQQCCPESGE